MRRPIRRRLIGWFVSVALVAAVSGVLTLLEGDPTESTVAVLYLFAVLPVAVVWGTAFGVVVSVASTAAYDFLFVPPRHSLAITDPRDWLRLAGFLAAALVVSELTARWRESARLAAEQAAVRRVAMLVARTVSPAEVFETVIREVGLLSGADLARMERYESDGAVTGVAAWSSSHELELAVGTRFALEGISIAALVRQTRGPVRVDSFADAFGAIAEEAQALGIRSSIGCPIFVGGRLWGVIAASSKGEAPFAADTESQIAEFTELVATAVANAESRAELTASRARVVATADETRRRIERDLHDGTQQHLVSLALELRAAAAAVPPELDELAARLSRAAKRLADVVDDLREISRGIHPAILSEGGLGPALKTLARRSAVRVELDVHTDRRLPGPVEVAAYYVVAEALTNATKHARASVVHVDLGAEDSMVQLTIRDDRVGGADPGQGSGLIGLRDRIEALGGKMDVASPTGNGTSLFVMIPIDRG
jgi:signal transduction histidine kinase